MVLYGDCGTKYRGNDDTSDKPIRLFHGLSDDYVAVTPCRPFVERLRAKGKDISLTEYKDAGHAFDAPAAAKPIRLANAQTWSRCRREESADGKIVNAETGQPFTFKDSCVDRGATLAYDAEAHAAVQRAVQEFVAGTLAAK